jgi:dUTP pyrophosphatase
MKFTKLTSTAITPTRATTGAAGLDLYADADVFVLTGESVMLGTGIAVEVPLDHVGLVFIRSSLGKAGVGLTNAVGVIDSDYRGEIMLSLASTSGHYIRRGDRVAQMIIMPVVPVEMIEVDALSTTDRGAGSFGSTGR